MPIRRLLPTGTVGAISELVAAIHLTRRGYHVFRAIDPGCPCDLIAMRGTNLWRVQVRTGAFDRNGTPTCVAKGEHDVLACVIGDEVFYTPDMPDMLSSVKG